MSEEHRTKISNSKILNRLIECGEGSLDMSPTQANVGVALMKKCLPDLQAIQHSGDADNPINHLHKIERVIVKAPDSDSTGIRAAATPSKV